MVQKADLFCLLFGSITREMAGKLCFSTDYVKI